MNTPAPDPDPSYHRIKDADRFIEVLMWRHAKDLERFVRPLAQNSDEASDIVQETWIKACKAARAGKFQEQGHTLAWLYVIAKRVAADRRSAAGQVVELDDDQMADPRLGVESQVIVRDLADFLEDQLAQALGIESGSPEKNGTAKLKYLAFFYFYDDRMGVSEIASVLEPKARRAGVKPPTSYQVQNWLSGGRILSKLIEHLVVSHPAALEKLTENTVAIAGLTEKELDAWAKGPPAVTPKARTDSGKSKSKGVKQTDLAKVDDPWKDALEKVVAVLHREIFRCLHDSRTKNSL